MCNVAYYPDNAPITIDLVSNSTSAQTMVSPSSFSGTLPPSPVVDSRIVTAVISDSTTLIQYMCQVNITIDDITLTSISSDPVYVVIQGTQNTVCMCIISMYDHTVCMCICRDY